NSKKLMKELLAKFNFSLPKCGSILEGEVINLSLLNVLIDLGSFGSGIVYPREFYDDPEKQKALKPGQKIKMVLLNLENEEGLKELSLKRAQMKSAWQEVKEIYEKGEIISVKIANLNKGGLIAEIAGIQAFMPLSQLAEEHYPKVENGNIQEIVKILQAYRSQEFKVKIIDIDEGQNKLIISEKAAKAASEKEKAAEHWTGEIVEGKILETTDFGAFVKLDDGTEALMPKSEMDEETQELKPGDKIKAVIIEASPDKIVLSSKTLKSNEKNG
ncbi:MAG: S1 RNA-binding domain-containing protein, partial [Patescibacteria group bacterium]